ncbi:MAG: beta-ketoacyl-ACP synthase II [Alphaproteobacteria bacterium]|nr:beta-ketoacyl-ACP synthase II [Alphaproteobacteria bacterium]
MRRVVITGMGVVSPLGRGLETNWNALKTGKSGVVFFPEADGYPLAVKIAGHIPRGENSGQLDVNSVLSVKEQRHHDAATLYGVAAAMDAMQDAGFLNSPVENKEKFGVVFGSGQGGLNRFFDGVKIYLDQGANRISPFFMPSIIINQTAGFLSIKYGLEGPNLAVSTACATGTHSIGEAYQYIQAGYADRMLAGSTEAPLNPLGIAGFAQMRALSKREDTPQQASRPWDKKRDGFVMAEGAGALVLEEYESAKARGAKIYAEIIGYGLSADAYHITAPGGTGAIRAMQMALNQANLQPAHIDYINAHGTSTPAGDMVEFCAVKEVFGVDGPAMSSTKSMTGHMLGAAGSVEAVYSVLSLIHNVMPPTINLANPEEETQGFNLVPNQAQEKQLNIVLSNSFGFGGTNACLIFKKV